MLPTLRRKIEDMLAKLTIEQVLTHTSFLWTQPTFPSNILASHSSLISCSEKILTAHSPSLTRPWYESELNSGFDWPWCEVSITRGASVDPARPKYDELGADAVVARSVTWRLT